MEALKEQGKDFRAAAELYERAIAAAKELPSHDLAPLHSNCSFAYLKQGELPQALAQAESAVAASLGELVEGAAAENGNLAERLKMEGAVAIGM